MTTNETIERMFTPQQTELLGKLIRTLDILAVHKNRHWPSFGNNPNVLKSVLLDLMPLLKDMQKYWKDGLNACDFKTINSIIPKMLRRIESYSTWSNPLKTNSLPILMDTLEFYLKLIVEAPVPYENIAQRKAEQDELEDKIKAEVLAMNL